MRFAVREPFELRLLNERLEQRVLERTRELEASQERLRHSERLASIGTLAAGVAHEIRNPLNSILLATQVALRYSASLDESVREMLVTIGNETKRCAAIIRNILLFARAEQTEKAEQDFNDVVRHAVDLARSYLVANKAEISIEVTDQALPVRLNTTEIEQVIVNLINNAVESAPNGVQIHLRTEAVPERARLVVSDTGSGIPEENLKHIFDPFFSTKRKRGNTGLGLSLSHGIVTEHGGTMEVESTVGQGTTFVIEIPKEA